MENATEPRTMSRSEAVDLLRERCAALVDDEHSLCEVAARMRILCHGWKQWSFGELKEKHDWIVRNRPGITRQELEDLANRWQLARQRVKGTASACDTQQGDEKHRLCRGWDEHDEETLAGFVEELTGERVRVEPDLAE